jgi:hypothetical protein
MEAVTGESFQAIGAPTAGNFVIEREITFFVGQPADHLMTQDAL